MNIYNLVANTSNEVGKSIAIGIVAFGLFYTIYLISKRKEIKKDWKRNSHLKEVGKIDSKISQLKILKNQNIIDDNDFDTKLKGFEAEKKTIKVEYYLKQNERFKTLQRSLEKGFINEEQFNTKVEEIKGEILKNVR